MIEIIREEGETIDRLLRRYSESLKRINFFQKVKSSNVCGRKPSKRQQKQSALYKMRKRTQMEYLKKVGKIEEEPFGYKNYGYRKRKTG
ncbi:MAG: hypothetical protein ABH896_02010 [Candidatus Jacksonbacteria bacterium]